MESARASKDGGDDEDDDDGRKVLNLKSVADS